MRVFLGGARIDSYMGKGRKAPTAGNAAEHIDPFASNFGRPMDREPKSVTESRSNR